MGEKQKVRILFLARYIYDNGVTTHMLTLGNGLMKQGHEVALLSGGSESKAVFYCSV